MCMQGEGDLRLFSFRELGGRQDTALMRAILQDVRLAVVSEFWQLKESKRLPGALRCIPGS